MIREISPVRVVIPPSTPRCSSFMVYTLSVCLSIIGGSLGISYGEIYTYEKDGVIVISSEPPPKPKRRRGTRGRSRRQRESSKRTIERGGQTRAQTSNRAQISNRGRTPQRSSKSPRLPRVLHRYNKSLSELALKYHLPARILYSVVLSCSAEARHSHLKNDESSRGERYTCLHPTVDSLIEGILSKSAKRNKRVGKEAEALKSKELINSFDRSLWLLRKLVNRYRGDVTLALSSYYQASQLTEHPIFKHRAQPEQSLNILMNKSRSSYNRSELSSRELMERARRFTRLTLSLLRGDG